MDSVIAIVTENYVAVIASVVVLVVLFFAMGSKKHPLESPYIHRGIPVLGNFIAFAKGIHLFLHTFSAHSLMLLIEIVQAQ